MSFAPTAEQTEALDLFLTGWPLVIEAGAGTGKTSTLQLLASETPKACQYVAFNKAIVVDAGSKMPGNVTANTAHSLAMRAVGSKFRHRLDSGRVKSHELARMLNVQALDIYVNGDHKRLGAGYLASHVMRGIGNFCQSADPEPTVRHLPYIDGIDPPTGTGKRTFDNNRLVEQCVAGALGRAWADLTRPDGVLPYNHAHYLKLWELSEPRIYSDVILFDEAQDATPVMLSIISQQTEAQRVYVGDTQQQLYEWLGAVNALSKIEGANRAFLTQSFRFGPEIARTANLVLDWLEAELSITGTPSIESTVGRVDRPDAILCRTNAVAVQTVLSHLGRGDKVHLVGGAQEVVRFANAAKDLDNEGWTSHPELACFDSWGEVRDYVANDPQGSDLKLMVKLVDEYTPDVIIDGLKQTIPEPLADVIVSTAHKSKGREWPTVQLAGDFPEEVTDDLGELRLLYVAVTRARQRLDHSAVPMFFDSVRANEAVA